MSEKENRERFGFKLKMFGCVRLLKKMRKDECEVYSKLQKVWGKINLIYFGLFRLFLEWKFVIILSFFLGFNKRSLLEEYFFFVLRYNSYKV